MQASGHQSLSVVGADLLQVLCTAAMCNQGAHHADSERSCRRTEWGPDDDLPVLQQPGQEDRPLARQRLRPASIAV
jgi:hypothetical protein